MATLTLKTKILVGLFLTRNGYFIFWHIDSRHKLIRWRLVIHGCIDCYSRLIIYLHCCNKNKAETVKAQFLRSILTFFWPRRVRSDHGMEKIEVAGEILKKFGTLSKSFLTGLSVHNQRIERLREDVLHYVLHYCIDLLISWKLMRC